MQTGTRIAVAGATGRVGRHVVDVLTERGHDVVGISRSQGVDVVSGDGLAEALRGAEVIVDATTGASPDREEATAFFTAAARNLHEHGRRAGARGMVVVSIIGTDRFAGGYNAAKCVHERIALAGPLPARIVRAAQFHEFVDQMADWGRRGDVVNVPRMRTQLVAARSVAEVLADAAEADWDGPTGLLRDVAGPREENLAEAIALLGRHRGDPARVVEFTDPSDPDMRLLTTGALLPGPDAILAGPTFAEWLETAPVAAAG